MYDFDRKRNALKVLYENAGDHSLKSSINDNPQNAIEKTDKANNRKIYFVIVFIMGVLLFCVTIFYLVAKNTNSVSGVAKLESSEFNGSLATENSNTKIALVDSSREQSSFSSNKSPASQISLSASGYVVARTMATVSSNVTGRIKEIYFEEGAFVEKGQVLALIDDAVTKVDVDLYRSRLELAKVSIAESKALLSLAVQDLARFKVLSKSDFLSDIELSAKTNEVEVLRAKLLTAESSVNVARQELKVAERNLEEYVIRAPFAGVVISKNAQPGEIVSPVSTGDGYTRTGISTIVDMNTLEIEVDVNESYIHRAYPEQKVKVRLESYSDLELDGKVIKIVPAVNRQKATVKVRVALSELNEKIMPNMGAQVDFID